MEEMEKEALMPFRTRINDPFGTMGTGESGGKHRKKGKHQKPAFCAFSWQTRPEVPGGHADHTCGLIPEHKGNHVCRFFLCDETHS